MQKGRRHNRQLHNRPNIALRLAAVLLIMVCISTWMMDGLFAKYRTSSSGQDSARVIGFGNLTLTESGDFPASGGQAYLIPGVDLKKDVVVEFTGSEAATYVFVEAELSKNWKTSDKKLFFIGSTGAEQLKWNVATGWNFLKEIVSENKNTYVYYRKLKPNEEMTAKFIDDSGKITVSRSIKRADMDSLNGIMIDLRASVVQSNGFADVNAAWTSISGK